MDYAAITVPAEKLSRKKRASQYFVRRTENVLGTIGSFFYWTLPGLGLNAGQSKLITLIDPSALSDGVFVGF